ncbi:uncharacterized protein LOC143264822 isoform X3 [Megachile rotundata]|uniref:uncharacterized protein LOC143264822 isoform X3 n=1 Tax=Megachile rotundata TaxID=143995 RepID=UPI003FD0D961
MAIIRFAVRASIVGGIVYYSYTEGLWSRSEETAKLYEKIYVNVAPYVKENIPNEVTQQEDRNPITDIWEDSPDSVVTHASRAPRRGTVTTHIH